MTGCILEKQVVYVSISDDNDIWVRPATMFLDMVERDGKRFQRFEFLGELGNERE